MTITLETKHEGRHEVVLEQDGLTGVYTVSLLEERGAQYYVDKSAIYADKIKAKAAFRRYAKSITK